MGISRRPISPNDQLLVTDAGAVVGIQTQSQDSANPTYSIGSGTKAISVAGSSDYTLSLDEWLQFNAYDLSGALTGNISLIAPERLPHIFIADNSTSGSYNITVKHPSTTGVVVPQGQKSIFYTNGTTIDYITSVSGSGGKLPYLIVQQAKGAILPYVSANSRVSQTGSVVTVSNAGASAVTSNLPTGTYDGYFVYFPGSSGNTGVTGTTGIAAGWYSGFSAGTSGTYVFSNTTASVSAQPVNSNAAYNTQTNFVTCNIPAGALGVNGAVRITDIVSVYGSTNNKTIKEILGSTTFGSNATATAANISMNREIVIRCRGVTNKQVAQPQNSAIWGWSTATPVYGTEETSAGVTAIIAGEVSAVSEYMILEGYSIEILPGA